MYRLDGYKETTQIKGSLTENYKMFLLLVLVHATNPKPPTPASLDFLAFLGL